MRGKTNNIISLSFHKNENCFSLNFILQIWKCSTFFFFSTEHGDNADKFPGGNVQHCTTTREKNIHILICMHW